MCFQEMDLRPPQVGLSCGDPIIVLAQWGLVVDRFLKAFDAGKDRPAEELYATFVRLTNMAESGEAVPGSLDAANTARLNLAYNLPRNMAFAPWNSLPQDVIARMREFVGAYSAAKESTGEGAERLKSGEAEIQPRR